MRFLLDTHYAVELIAEASNISMEERRGLGRMAGRAAVSAVSIWELRIKWRTFHRSGDRKGPFAPNVALAALRAMGLAALPLTPDHAAHTLSPPLLHKDPFDDLLLAQAQVEGMRLLTRDRALLAHPQAMKAEDVPA